MSMVATRALLFMFEVLDWCMSDIESSYFARTFIFDLGFIMVPGSSLIGMNLDAFPCLSLI